MMSAKYGMEPGRFLTTLRATVMPSNKSVSDEELMAFCMVAHEYDLNPLTKEIYAFPGKGGGIVPMVSVDGWIKLMNRQAEFDGIEFECTDSDDGKPYSVTAKVYIKNRSKPVSVTEYYAECARQTDPWRTSPRRMLRHKALIQGARVAFGFSGIYDEDKAATIANVTPDAPAKPIFTAPKATVVPVVDAEIVGDWKTLRDAGGFGNVTEALSKLHKLGVITPEQVALVDKWEDIPAEVIAAALKHPDLKK